MYSKNSFKNDIDNIKKDIKKKMIESLISIGKEATRDINNNFKKEGLSTDITFYPWKRSFAAARRIKKGQLNKTTLIDTERLKRSIHYQVNIEKINLLIGFDKNLVPYGEDHDKGINTVRRQFMYLKNSILNKNLKFFEKK